MTRMGREVRSLVDARRGRSARPDRRSKGLGVEGLESRAVPATLMFTPIPTPTPNAAPFDITNGPDGNLWFTEGAASVKQLGRLNPATHAITEFPVPNAPEYMTTGPDNNLWFTETDANKVAVFVPATGAVTEFPTPTANSGPEGITVGPDVHLWFTEYKVNKIGVINPTTHAISEIPIPTANGAPASIVARGGALWFTELHGDKIGRIDPRTHAITEFPVPTAMSQPSQITIGPDGNLWFTELNAGKVAELVPATGAITEYATPTANSGPDGIKPGPDGNLWFIESFVNNVASINPTTHAISEYPIPGAQEDIDQLALTADGRVWIPIEGASLINVARIPTVPPPTPVVTHLALNVSPNPVADGQAVTFTAVVSAQAGTATPAGTVTFTVDGQAQTPTPLSVVNGRAQATITRSDLGVGQHVVAAAYNPSGNFAVSSNTKTAVVTPAVSNGPIVVGVYRYGYHYRPTTLLVAFDQPLNPASANNARAYTLTDPYGRIIPVVPFYVAASHTVILSPARLLNLHRTYTLEVAGAGPNAVLGATGLPLGSQAGRPGISYVTLVTKANWVRPLTLLGRF